MTYDAIVIGAGHNALTCAAYLGRAGLRVLVVERRNVIGGAAATEEIFPGFRFDTCAHVINGIHPSVSNDLALARHGLDLTQPESCVFAPNHDGPPLTLWTDLDRSAAEIKKFSTSDANGWSDFVRLVSSTASFLKLMYGRIPINAPKPDLSDAATLVGVARHFKGLSKPERAELLSVLPASVAEILDDRFETNILKGIVAAAGVFGIFQGPLAAGTAYTLFHTHAYATPGTIRSCYFARNGIGTLAASLANAAKDAGVAIRTAATVRGIMVKEGRAIGVILDDGEELLAHRVVSGADPRHTFLNLLDAATLTTDVIRKTTNIKFRGAIAKVNLALGELPRFTDTKETHHLMGAITIAPSIDYLERAYDDAKYGSPSNDLFLDLTIPSLTNPSMAPDGRHILSVSVQYVPHKRKDGSWTEDSRQSLGDRVIETIARYAPNVPNAVIHSQVITPSDLEKEYGLTEGNANHGELTLDQLYFMRPIPGWSDHRSPVENLYLCGAGTHAGGGVTCAAGFNASQIIKKDVKRG